MLILVLSYVHNYVCHAFLKFPNLHLLIGVIGWYETSWFCNATPFIRKQLWFIIYLYETDEVKSISLFWKLSQMLKSILIYHQKIVDPKETSFLTNKIAKTWKFSNMNV